jgi:hypothetical protein
MTSAAFSREELLIKARQLRALARQTSSEDAARSFMLMASDYERRGHCQSYFSLTVERVAGARRRVLGSLQRLVRTRSYARKGRTEKGEASAVSG